MAGTAAGKKIEPRAATGVAGTTGGDYDNAGIGKRQLREESKKGCGVVRPAHGINPWLRNSGFQEILFVDKPIVTAVRGSYDLRYAHKIN